MLPSAFLVLAKTTLAWHIFVALVILILTEDDVSITTKNKVFQQQKINIGVIGPKNPKSVWYSYSCILYDIASVWVLLEGKSRWFGRSGWAALSYLVIIFYLLADHHGNDDDDNDDIQRVGGPCLVIIFYLRNDEDINVIQILSHNNCDSHVCENYDPT